MHWTDHQAIGHFAIQEILLSSSMGSGEVKRRKLLPTSDEDMVASRSIAALSVSTQKAGSPPDLDVVCVERSVPLEEGRRTEVESMEEPVLGVLNDSQKFSVVLKGS